ncbi:MAG: inorganic phosphate transporter, partial [Candidatus Micrarchaeota archaeon]|nr:inorganic phosphate transporter [Candidatus Micrarchaeota archaeon]
LLFFLVALVSGNNMPTCFGPAISSGIIGRKTGILATIIGYMLGFLVEGWLLKAGLLSLMPIQSEALVSLALVITMLMFLISHVLRVPQSLSITFTMVIIGIGIGYGTKMNMPFVVEVIAFWVLSALIAGVVTFAMMKIAFRFMPKVRVWMALSRIKPLLVLISFFTAFVLGANTIGFLYASVSNIVDPLYATEVTLAAIIFGSILLSRGELNRMGNEILPLRYVNALISQTIAVAMVQIATFFSIPASNTQTLILSIYGAGLSYKVRLLRKRPIITIAFAWISTAVVSLLLGYIVTKSIYHL